jgi:hypothetical protein
MKRPSTEPLEFSPSLLHRLNLYALTATAAGVGTLALSPTAEAKVVYTPTHVEIPCCGYFLDLNNDGISDFNLNINGNSRGHSDSGYFSIQPVASQNLIWGHGNVPFGPRPRIAAFDLPFGFQVGPGNEAVQPTGAKLLAGYYFFSTTGGAGGHGLEGPWDKGTTTGYLGLSFSIDGETHFGWARLTVTIGPNKQARALLTGYAYETIANKAITAGKTSDPSGPPETSSTQPDASHTMPASLGVLALGSAAIPFWRRDSATN